jgi:hypothetical protein
MTGGSALFVDFRLLSEIAIRPPQCGGAVKMMAAM